MATEVVNPTIELSIKLSNQLILSLLTKAVKVRNKYEYYNADNEIRDFGISTPAKMLNTKPGVGWASRAVNTLSDRVVFDGFANDTYGINELFEDMNAHSILSKAKDDAFIGGCAFVAVADIDDGSVSKKTLIPFDAMEATGKIDQRTGLLKYGLAVTKWAPYQVSEHKKGSYPSDYILFTPDFTSLFRNRTLVAVIPNPTGRCLLHPLTRRASANQPLGKSRITKTVRRIIQEVARLKRRSEIAQEFYSTPQRYINGLAAGAQKDASLDSAIGKIWAINVDENGDKPDIGQLAQMTIDQFNDAKKDLARDFCSETALTLRNLGYETGNPTSAESLTAMSDDLLLEAVKSQEEMGEQIKQIAITTRMLVSGIAAVPTELKKIVPSWKPIFQLDIGAAGDAVYKLFTVMPELQGTVSGYRMLGIGIREAEQLASKRTTASNQPFMIGGTK